MNETKLKQILTEMNRSEFSLAKLCDVFEQDYQGSLIFSNLKTALFKYYSQMHKTDLVEVLKAVVKIQPGLIKIYPTFNYFQEILGKPIDNPLILLYKMAYVGEFEKQLSTIELVYASDLQLSDEIDIATFLQKVSPVFDLSPEETKTVFKALDYTKLGKVKIEDLALVVDSFREDYLRPNQQKDENFLSQVEIEEFLAQMDRNSLTIESLFYEINSTSAETASIQDLLEVLRNNIGDEFEFEIAEKLLNHLYSIEELGVRKADFKLFIEEYSKKAPEPVGKTRFMSLNDNQVHWLTKFTQAVAETNLTPAMLFVACAESSTDSVRLEKLKRRVRLVIPKNKLDNYEINCIFEALNVNRSGGLTRAEFNEILETLREKHKAKLAVTVENEKRAFTNLWVSGKKSVNYHLIPVKGNFKVIEKMKTYFSKTERSFSPAVKEVIKTVPSMNHSAQLRSTIRKSTNKGKKEAFDVFEEKEIDLVKEFEALEIHTKSGLKPIFELYNQVKSVFGRLVNRKQIYELICKIDYQQTGFFSYLSLSKYLLDHKKHRSTTLAFKEMARFIQKKQEIPTEQFFEELFLGADEYFTRSSLVRVLEKTFGVEGIVSKKIYDDLFVLVGSEQGIQVKEIVHKINGYRTDKETVIQGEEDDFASIPDFEEKVRDVCRRLTVAYGSEDLIENLETALNLPEELSFKEYRVKFLNKLEISESLGFVIFNLLRKLSENGKQTVKTEDLLVFLDSYAELDEESEEEEHCYDMCFESIPFAPNGKIAVIEVKNYLEEYFKGIDKAKIAALLKKLDSNRDGVVDYYEIQSFLTEHSVGNTGSVDIEFKLIASHIHKLKYDTSEYFLQRAISDTSNVKLETHKYLLSDVCSSSKMLLEVFHFLSKKSKSTEGYHFNRLIDHIDYHRGSYEAAPHEQISKETVKQTYSTLCERLQFEDIVGKIKLGSANLVSVTELFSLIKANSRLKHKEISEFLLFIDSARRGTVSLLTLLNKILVVDPQFTFPYSLIRDKIKNEAGCCDSPTDYLERLGLFGKETYSFDKFEFAFKDTCLTENCLKELFVEFSDGTKFSVESFKTLCNMPSKQAAPDFIDFDEDFATGTEALPSPNVSFKDSPSRTNKTKKSTFSVRLKSFKSFKEIEPNKRANSDKKQVEDWIRELEEKEIELKDMFNYLTPERMNNHGIVSRLLVENTLEKALKLDENSAKQLSLCYSDSEGSVDLLNIVISTLLYSNKDSTPFEDVVDRLKMSISKLGIPLFSQFKAKYGINELEPVSIKKFAILCGSIFKLSFFDALVLFKEVEIPQTFYLKEKRQTTWDKFFSDLDLYALFGREVKKEYKLDSYMQNALEKLNFYFNSKEKQEEMFRKFDFDGNGTLDTLEFMGMLENLPLKFKKNEINVITKLADVNGDGSINFFEFSKFLGKAIISKNTLDKRSSNSKGFFRKVDLDLNQFYRTFKANKAKFRDDLGEVDKLLYSLQKTYYLSYNDFDNIETIMVRKDVNTLFVIEREEFLGILANALGLRFTDDQEKALIDFAHADFSERDKEKLNLNRQVRYMEFIKNISLFQLN